MIIKSAPRIQLIRKQDGLLEKLEKKSAFRPIEIIKAKKEVLPVLTKEFIEEKKEVQLVKKEQPMEQIMIKETKLSLQPSQAIKESDRAILPAQEKEKKEILVIAPLQPVEQKTIPTMEKLLPFIADPAVSAINCPGPGKNIILTRLGMIQQINLALTKEEIENFLKDISSKTKIPLVAGLFKVIYQNLLITAIVSDYMDNKFLIEKRIPAVLQAPVVTAAPQQIVVRTSQPVRVQFK